MDHKLAGIRFEMGGRLQISDVGAMPALSHGEDAKKVKVDCVLDVALMALGAQRIDGSAPQPPTAHRP